MWELMINYKTAIIIFIYQMGQTCKPQAQTAQQAPKSTIYIQIIDKPKNKEDLVRKYASIRDQASSFPLTNNHVDQKITKLSKFQPCFNKIWKLHSPYNLIYVNQYAQDQYQLPKRYVKIFKLKENGEFAGYYEGKVTSDFQPDLTLGFFVFPNASYFQGTGTNQGKYTNQVTNLRYEGQWVNQQPHGKGEEKNNKGEYQGDYYQGEKNGKGEFVWNDGSSYVGTFVKGSIHGKGLYTNPSLKYFYQGEFNNDTKHGLGVETKMYQVYTGSFYNNQRFGLGKLVVFQDEEKKNIKYSYQGSFEDNQPHGKGTYAEAKSRKKITGIWKNGILITISQ